MLYRARSHAPCVVRKTARASQGSQHNTFAAACPKCARTHFLSNGGVHLPAVCAHRIEAGELFGFTQGASDTNPNGNVPSVSPIDPSDHFARPGYDRQSRQSRPGPLLG